MPIIDNRKLPELKAEAKRLGLNNYSRLRKQELIDLLRNQNRAPASEAQTPARTKKIPAPRSEARAPARTKPKLSPKEIERKIKRLQKKLRTINQKMKNNKKKKCNLHQKQVKSKLEKELDEIRGKSEFRITELASALRGFARQFRIEGIPRHALREFLQKVKTEVLKLMRKNRRPRVRMILNCEMRREELFSEEVQI